MADENTNVNDNAADDADILSKLLGAVSSSNKQEKLLESIDKSMKTLLRNSKNISMSNAAGYDFNQRGANKNATFSEQYKSGYNVFGRTNKKQGIGSMSEFTDAFEEELLSGFLGSDFKDTIRGAFDRLASDMGVSTQEISKSLGKYAGQTVFNAFKNTKIGQGIADKFENYKNSFLDKVSADYNKSVSEWYDKHPNMIRPGFGENSVKDIAASNAAPSPEDSKQPKELAEKSAETAADKSDSYTINAENIVVHAQSVSVQNAANSPDIADAESKAEGIKDMADTAANAIDTADDVSDVIKMADTATDTAEAAGAASKAAGAVEAGATGAAEAGAVEAGAAGLGGVASGAASAIGPGIAAIGAALPEILLVIAALAVLKLAIDNVCDAIEFAAEGAKELIEKSSKAANRYSESQKKNLETAQKRLYADVETMVKRPFEILEAAANKWYQTWDNNLRIINGTQGYNKEELQSLMGAFADRLREENLTSVVSASDISDNLAKVLESGLSGRVAEEFAYIATKLNAAIPTQDFFSYASTYSSIAANAIKTGKSQSEAIAMANAQLELFANNLLYAGREVAGGFTTGLKNAETLFEQSVQIAQAAHTDNANDIAGVMTAVSAITGAIAPDLANSMTDAIYNAAVGGNSSDIVALRSLAGINASNTEFLRQLTQNPKKVFVNLFTELAKRQNMSPDARMEVAEGLSEVFGVSMDALARVDFAYLAQAIDAMNTGSGALAANMELLASGQTTTNDEMLKMQQINKYMIDEGLAYVIDNEAARFIQQHMWEEQQQRKLMEATYSVELQGAALEFLEGIRQTIDNILGFLNPMKILGKLANLSATAGEAIALNADISALLEAGKVGRGNADSKYQLTKRNADLNVTDNIINMLGGTSEYEKIESWRKFNNALANPRISLAHLRDNLFSKATATISTFGFSDGFTGNSSYKWGTIGKSIAKQLAATLPNISNSTSMSANSPQMLSQTNQPTESEKSNKKFQDALNSMSDYVKTDTEHKLTYDDWKDFAVDKFLPSKNILNKYENFSKSMSAAGLSEEALKGQFDMLQTQVAAQEKLEREKREETFWENNSKLLTTTTELLESINNHTENIFKKFEDYFSEWTKYFIDHAVYNSTFTHEDYDKIVRQDKENSETAILTLADALTQNDVKLLLDPTVQTNALLAQILKVAVGILEQAKTPGASISFADTIAGLSLGIVEA